MYLDNTVARVLTLVQRRKLAGHFHVAVRFVQHGASLMLIEHYSIALRQELVTANFDLLYTVRV